MEADEAVPVVGLHYQKYDRRNNGHVGKSADYIVGESTGGCRGGAGRCGWCCGWCTCSYASTCRTCICSCWHLSATGYAKRHDCSPRLIFTPDRTRLATTSA